MRIRRPGPGQSVTVVGLARSGEAAARLLLRQGCFVRVTESADRPQIRQAAAELEALGAEVEVGRHTRLFVRGASLLVTSPGVPPGADPIRWAGERGTPVIGELELGSWYCSGRIAAVTGSNGKSTVVSLIGKMLQASGQETVVCGNIGQPLTGQIDRIGPRTAVVLEVSSFQLESSLSFHAKVGAVLNLSDNHLDRHGSFKAYREAKARLLTAQQTGEWTVLNADSPGSSSMKSEVRGGLLFFSRLGKVPGAWVEQGEIRLDLPGCAGPVLPVSDLRLRGAHNEENALAAACMAGLMGASPETIAQTLKNFPGLPHRQERVAQIRGVTFINDSKSTTVASGIRAIEAAPGQVVLIAGGRDKGSDFHQLRAWTRKLKAAVLIGEDGPKIAACLKKSVPTRRAGTLQEAVRAAFELAGCGECVLLSPMCTSFDMFRDFEERGDQFTQAVQEMAV